MPCRQQKSAKKGSERYLTFGLNQIFVTLRWDDGRSPGHEKLCRWLLNSVSTKKVGCSEYSIRFAYLSTKMKKKRNKRKKSKSVKYLRYIDGYFFSTNDFSLLESCQQLF